MRCFPPLSFFLQTCVSLCACARQRVSLHLPVFPRLLKPVLLQHSAASHLGSSLSLSLLTSHLTIITLILPSSFSHTWGGAQYDWNTNKLFSLKPLKTQLSSLASDTSRCCPRQMDVSLFFSEGHGSLISVTITWSWTSLDCSATQQDFK